jgi:hypothetical protein
MICAKAMPAVSGLEQEFPGKVKAGNVDATTEEGQKAAKELGWRNHGIVIRDTQGKALFNQADHGVNLEDVRKALRDLLKS